MRLIDADALMKTLGITDMDCDKCAWCDKEWSRCKRGSDFEDACCAIENAPTIEERKTGRWINANEGKWNTIEVLKCSVCGEMDNRMYRTDNFCPNCGAMMEGGEHETDRR